MKVFFSYSSKDEVLTEEIDEKLRRYGVNVFRDKRDLQPMDNVTHFMQSIKKMDYSIMLISENYLCSTACLFEFTEFLKKNEVEKFLIPIMADNFQLSTLQRDNILTKIRKEVPTYPSKHWLKRIFTSFQTKNTKQEKEVRFLETWNYLSRIKLFSLPHSRVVEFKDLLSFLKLYDGEIERKLDKIVHIKNNEDQDIAFDQLISEHPGSYWVIRYRAYLCTVQHQNKKAIHFFQQFLSKFSDPMDKVTTYYDIGICHYNLKAYEDAIKAQEMAIQIEPNAYLSYRALGDIYLAQKKYDKAHGNYLQSCRYKKDPVVLNNLGVIERFKGNFNQAIQLLNEAIELNAGDPAFFINLYHTYQQNGQKSLQDKTLLSAVNKFPNNPIIITDFAMRHTQEDGNIPLSEIIKYLKKSFKIDSSYIDTRMFLGYCLMLYHSKNPASKELIFAKNMMLETLEMELTSKQKLFVLGNLKLLLLLIKDSFTLAQIKKNITFDFISY